MPAFHYIALNQTGKELSGVIEAESDVAARKNLNNLKLSVVSLEMSGAGSDTAKAATNHTTFEFEGRDKNGRKVTGTIAAETPVMAFARLFEEYELSVTLLFPANASEAEKSVFKKTGIAPLQQEYENTIKKKPGQEEAAAEGPERRELLEKIEFTMQRVGTFLKDSGADMKDEERDVIQGYMNQLIRIKDSTNLDHIRTTCEKMLSHIQKKELFLHEEDRLQESARMKMETQSMLSQLKRTGLQQDIDIVKTASHWQEHPLLKPIASFVLRLFGAEDLEVRKLREELRTVKQQMWTYLKLLIIGKSNVVRTEAWESLKHLREEKKRLTLQLLAVRTEARKKHRDEEGVENVFSGSVSLIGWMLSFYLLVYIVGFPFSVKQFNLPGLPKGFYFYHSTFTRGVTLLLFFLYIAVTIRRLWLQESRFAPLMLYPASLFAFLLLAINLL